MSDAASNPAKEETVKDSLIGHLIELRSCVLHAVVALVAGIFLVFPFSDYLFTWLALPLLQELAGDGELVSITVLGPFVVRLTTSFFVAFWLTLPYLLYQAWRFIAPGLYQNEKSLLFPLLLSSTLLFSLGMAFAYFFVFKAVFSFIAAVAPDMVKWTPDVAEYFSFLVKIFLGFGLAFETPVAVFILVRSGFVELETMRRARPWVIVGAFVVAAIITPPDVISQFMLAVPCWLLYEVGLLLAPRKVKKKGKDKQI